LTFSLRRACAHDSPAYGAGWLFLATLVAAGCRSQPYVNAHIETVNAEYRQLEDYVYALEADNARLQQELSAARAAAPAGGAPATRAVPGGGGLFRRPANIPAPLGGGRSSAGSPAAEPSPEFEPPVIEVPGGAPDGNSAPRTLRRPGTDSPAESPPLIEIPSLDQPPRQEPLPTPITPSTTKAPTPTDKKVTHLVLNPAMTGGVDFDGQPGDDGLKIYIEPRNAAEDLVAEPGALSVVVLDPTREGEQARIARWDFDAAATRQMLADSAPHGGMKLELPWPATAPAASRLQLFVRYTTPDGRRLQSDREVFVTPAGAALSRWTPRSTDASQAPVEIAVAAQPLERTGKAASAAPATYRDGEPSAAESSSEEPAKRLWPGWTPER
jgi:outer membrane murein-binding lipoprotein Lpp